MRCCNADIDRTVRMALTGPAGCHSALEGRVRQSDSAVKLHGIVQSVGVTHWLAHTHYYGVALDRRGNMYAHVLLCQR